MLNLNKMSYTTFYLKDSLSWKKSMFHNVSILKSAELHLIILVMAKVLICFCAVFYDTFDYQETCDSARHVNILWNLKKTVSWVLTTIQFINKNCTYQSR